jgi:hypothetical protein
MATVQTLIDRALRLLSQVPSGQSAGPDETADALEALNAIMDSWRNESLMCWSVRDETIPMTSGTSSYLIGPSGAIVSVRPAEVESAYLLIDTASHPLWKLTEEEYSAIPEKDSAGTYPDKFLYRATMPDGTLLVHPVPSGTCSVILKTRIPLAAFGAATDTVSLPPGWEEALTMNLAVEIAPEYEMEAKPSTVQRAVKSKAAIKRANHREAHLVTELALLGRGHGNILTG